MPDDPEVTSIERIACSIRQERDYYVSGEMQAMFLAPFSLKGFREQN
jgi:hypothetical protein